ncbi:hypothetical protein Angca_002733, partial [Angiostrongylus cantonensis]
YLSGAGKSTLLNVLTQRNDRDLRVFGEVAINNIVVENGNMKRYSAYVQQEDMFIAEVTVEEQLMFAARLRMPKNTTEDERKETVENLITSMGLIKCRYSRIGTATEKFISRSERKRLAFASEIITNPSILFCDEPTSGLDSFMALQVIAALKTLALKAKTVISTIHQPSTEVYQMADRIILLANGHVAYHGDMNGVEKFFTSCSYPCPMFVNLPDHFMKVLCRDENTPEQEHNKRVKEIVNEFECSEDGKHVHYVTHIFTSTQKRMKFDTNRRRGYPSSWLVQAWWLFMRSCRTQLRNSAVLRIRFLHVTALSLILGCVYYQVEFTKDSLMNYKGSAIRASLDMVFIFLYPCISVFTGELPIVIREYHAHTYHPTAFFAATNLANVPQYIILPTIYSVIVYGFAGYSKLFLQYFEFNVLNVTVANVATSAGYAAACIFGDNITATTFFPLIISPLLVLAGFFIDVRSIPIYFEIFTPLSWFKYSYEAHLIVLLRPINEIKGCPSNNTYDALICSANNGEELLKVLGFNPNSYWTNIFVLVLMIIGKEVFTLQKKESGETIYYYVLQEILTMFCHGSSTRVLTCGARGLCGILVEETGRHM